jgi:choline dehydrogenase-like flavoprotein
MTGGSRSAPEGWGFDDLLPFFRRTETAHGRDPALRGMDGPLAVGPATPSNPVLAACLDAAEEAGYRRADDISGGIEEGFGRADLNIVAGKRQCALDAYLRPAMQRGNLRVVTEALAHRLLTDRQRCVGVKYSAGGGLFRAGVVGEVVLTACAVGTPKLLMLSGIGPASALRPHGIDLVADLPGVGENLHDHPYAFIIYRPAQPVPAAANNDGEALGLLRSDPDLGYPDLQIIFVVGVHDRPRADAALQPRDGPAGQQQPGRRSRGVLLPSGRYLPDRDRHDVSGGPRAAGARHQRAPLTASPDRQAVSLGVPLAHGCRLWGEPTSLNQMMGARRACAAGSRSPASPAAPAAGW